MPTVHGPVCFRATAVGPRPHFSAPSTTWVAVGNKKTGPAPQIQPPAVGAFGEKNRLAVVSPRPDSFDVAAGKSRRSTSGTMVRVIRFQSSLSENGTTGCTFRRLTTAPSFAPP